MLGFKDRGQPELFVTGSLRQLLPDDHVLVRVDRALDLSWLRGEVAELYCPDNGRPGIDPEVAVRLMLAGLLLGIVHDRRLMREAQVNLAIRWFAGYSLHEALPDHSSLTRVRQRWGPERFKAVLAHTVEACIAARIATGEVVHLDATLIRADVSWAAVVDAHASAVLTEAGELDALQAPAEEVSSEGAKVGRVCRTDPDVSLGKGGRTSRVVARGLAFLLVVGVAAGRRSAVSKKYRVTLTGGERAGRRLSDTGRRADGLHGAPGAADGPPRRHLAVGSWTQQGVTSS